MMLFRFGHGLVWSAIACSLAAALTPAPAQAARSAQWRLSQVVGPVDGDTGLGAAVATSARDAWAVGSTCASYPSQCGQYRLLVEHWDGKAWARVPTPVSLNRNGTSVGGSAVAAVSADDAWVFAQTVRNTTLGSIAVHWNGHGWRKYTFPDWSSINEAAAFSPRNAWAFGSISTQSATKIYAVHWNGSRWQPVTVPGEPIALSALAWNDIWAVGMSAATYGHDNLTPQYVAMHWNGRAWRAIDLPALGTQSPVFIQATSAAATGPSSLWISYIGSELAAPPPTRAARHQSAAVPPGTPGLLHWDGSKWTRITTPYVLPASTMAPDGHGGLWLYQKAGGPTNGQFLYHYNAGSWTSQPLPHPSDSRAQLTNFAQVPGTSRLWGTGWIRFKQALNGQGAIYSFSG